MRRSGRLAEVYRLNRTLGQRPLERCSLAFARCRVRVLESSIFFRSGRNYTSELPDLPKLPGAIQLLNRCGGEISKRVELLPPKLPGTAALTRKTYLVPQPPLGEPGYLNIRLGRKKKEPLPPECKNPRLTMHRQMPCSFCRDQTAARPVSH